MKRLICIWMLFIMVFSSFSDTYADDSVTPAMDHSTDILEALGIFNDSDFSFEGYAVRSDAARLFVKMAGVNAFHFSDDTDLLFDDVDEENENSTYIYTAFKCGYVSGVSENLFEPNSKITRAQVAKIVVKILGYEAISEARGGFPAGYLYTANNLGIFSGISTSDEDGLTASEMSRIILNALSASIMIPESFGVQETYKTYEEKTLLSEKFDIYKTEAIIQADRYTSLYEFVGTEDNFIIADREKYSINFNCENVPLGCKCDIYYQQSKNSDNKRVLYMDACEDYNTVLSIFSADIFAESKEGVEYEDSENRTKKQKIASNASFIYNGQLNSYRPVMLADADEVKFVDNDKDGAADVVFVKQYTIIFTEEVSVKNDSVYGKQISSDGAISAHSYTFAESGNDCNAVFYYDNQKTGIYEIERESVLSVLIPANTAVRYTCFVYINDDFAQGRVESVNYSDGTIKINNKDYNAFGDTINTVFAGNFGKFYRDALGRIVYKKQQTESFEYGYLYGFTEKEFDTVKAKLFTTSGTWLMADLSNRVFINEKRMIASDIFYNSDLFDGGVLRKQLVKYKLSGDGVLLEIITAQNYTENRYSNEEFAAIDNDTFRLIYDNAKSVYRKSDELTCFGLNIHVDNNTKVFIIPSADSDSISDYSLQSIENLSHGTEYTNVMAYNADKNGVASIVVLEKNQSVSGLSDMMLVTGIGNSINATGDSVQSIKGICFGFEVKFNTEKEDTIEQYIRQGGTLSPGDVVRVVFNKDGCITALNRIFEYNNPSSISSVNNIIESDYYKEYTYVYGNEIYYDDSHIVLNYGINTGTFMIAKAPIIVYERKSNKNIAYIGTLADIETGDKIFGVFNYLKGKFLVIYKN